MLGLFIILLLVVPFLELALIIQVAGQIGVLPTLAVMLVVSILGGVLVKREGLGVLRRTQDRLAAGELPTNDLLDGLLILIAGALLLTPGFITDAVGLLLLFPPTRFPVRALLVRRFRARLQVAVVGSGFSAGPGFGASSRFGGTARFGQRVWDVDTVDDRPNPDRPDRPPELGPPA